MAIAVGVAFAARPSSSMLALTRQRAKWIFSPVASSSYSVQPGSSSTSFPPRKLILYSKPGCCLCDGLKEKLQAAFTLSGPDSLHDVDLQIRDITTNPEWERAYQYEIPVLARILSDGTEDGCYGEVKTQDIASSVLQEMLPRLSPRLGVELVQKKIAAALRQ
ncbi:hypothetical protein F0562_028131 [Nyssa sinensis]|uniref:Glutaredoxin-like protein n=1 Tax=Nyssa sinensis TaxID=561372 RepID=A0A5J5B759_9ASTE|nr:hypothetical protein F0562_028131 [Nyssa sinensis]